MQEEKIYPRVEIRQGKRGRFRWYLYDESGTLWAMGPIRGYETALETAEAAGTVAASDWRVDGAAFLIPDKEDENDLLAALKGLLEL